MASHVNSFNALLKRMIARITKQLEGDAEIASISKMVMMGIAALPEIAIEDTGKYLYKYREEILRADSRFLLEHTFGDDVASAEDRSQAEIAATLIPKLQRAYAGSNESEKENYRFMVIDMLEIYIEYKQSSFR